MTKSPDLVGKKFNRLTVIKRLIRSDKQYAVWECICDCGNITNVITSKLKSGSTKSCGCYKKEATRKAIYKGNSLFSGRWYLDFKKKAESRNLEWSLTQNEIINQYNIQNGKCCFTGETLVFPTNTKEWEAREKWVSIDRIDNNIGYNNKNIQLCIKGINICRGTLTVDDFLFYCYQIFDFQNNIYIPESRKIIMLPRSKIFKGYKNISKKYYSRLKRQSIRKSKSIDFNIDIKDIWGVYKKHNFCCAISGLPIDFHPNVDIHGQTASVDRINNNIGYHKNNIWVVHKEINRMKHKTELNKFIKMATDITLYTRENNVQ